MFVLFSKTTVKFLFRFTIEYNSVKFLKMSYIVVYENGKAYMISQTVEPCVNSMITCCWICSVCFNRNCQFLSKYNKWFYLLPFINYLEYCFYALLPPVSKLTLSKSYQRVSSLLNTILPSQIVGLCANFMITCYWICSVCFIWWIP